MLRIRDVLSRIPVPNFFHLRSRISIKEFKYFNPRKLFLKLLEIWSRLFISDPDTGSGYRIRSLNFLNHPRSPGVNKAPDSGFWFFTHPGSRIQGSKRHRIPDPEVKEAPDPGSRGQKGTGSRIQGSKRHRIPDPEVKKAPGSRAPGSATLQKKTSIPLFPSPAFQCVAACCSSRQNPLAWRGVCEGRRGWSAVGLSSATPPQVRPVSRVSAICRSASPPISFRKYGQLQVREIKYREKKIGISVAYFNLMVYRYV